MDFTKQFSVYELPQFGLVRLPEVYIPNTISDRLGVSSHIDVLKALTQEGWKKKAHLFDHDRIEEYKKQLEFEFEIIEDLGFTDYFLLVWMVINKAKELGAFIDYGRGSCAASLIFYLLDITGVDPIAKDLVFQRFISRVRAKKEIIDGITYLWGELAPDVDLNLGGVREEIIQWLYTLYEGKIAKITAISTLTGKILIKDVYKTVSNASEEQAKYVSDLIDKHFGIVEDIEKMPEKNEHFKKWTQSYQTDFDIALKLRGLIRGYSSHASGYFLSYHKLDEFIPYGLNKEKDLTVSYEMDDVALLGIKLDLLGLINNEIVKSVLENIPEKIEDINLKLDDDPLIYDQFQMGNLLPYGLYQISADCAYRVVNDVKAKNIFELSDVNAIARPGALAYLKGYVENKNPCPHPIFEAILKPTRNYCLYQEQMMRMAVAVGFSLEESEQLRRIVGKKKVDEVEKWKAKIYDKVKEKGLDITIGDLLWKILEDSSKYSFNLSHSLSTSYLSALTVYLKYKYPLHYYLACLNATKNLPDPIQEISIIQSELVVFGIQLLPPHIIKSDIDFKIEGNNIRFGLGQIKSISEKSIEKLNKFKKQHSNKFEIFEAANEAKIPISILGSLILVGALDDTIKQGRSRVLLEAQLWGLLTPNEKKLAKIYGRELNYDLLETVRHIIGKVKNEKGKPVMKASRAETLRRDFQEFREMYEFNIRNEQWAAYHFENQLLGYAYSSKLIDIFKNVATDLISIQEIKDSFTGRKIRFVGLVTEVKEWIAKNERKTKCLKCKIKDETSSFEVLAFDDAINQIIENNGRKVEENDVIVVYGTKKDTSVTAWEIGIQPKEVFIKISEMKKIKK